MRIYGWLATAMIASIAGAAAAQDHEWRIAGVDGPAWIGINYSRIADDGPNKRVPTTRIEKTGRRFANDVFLINCGARTARHVSHVEGDLPGIMGLVPFQPGEATSILNNTVQKLAFEAACEGRKNNGRSFTSLANFQQWLMRQSAEGYDPANERSM